MIIVLLIMLKLVLGTDSQLIDMKFQDDLYQKGDLLEKEISLNRAKESWKRMESLFKKHDIDFLGKFDKEFFEDLVEDAKKP